MLESTVNTNRYIPSCMNAHLDYMTKSEDFVFANCEVFYTTTNQNSGNKFYAMGFVGKSKNHAWYFQFASEDRMIKKINEFVENQKSNQTAKVERKAKQKEALKDVVVKVGDIFVNSWGYDQTNVDYYQVVSYKGKTVELREIASQEVAGTSGYMCCEVRPVKDAFLKNSESFKKRITASYDDKPYISFEYGSGSLVEGDKTNYCSWYA